MEQRKGYARSARNCSMSSWFARWKAHKCYEGDHSFGRRAEAYVSYVLELSCNLISIYMAIVG